MMHAEVNNFIKTVKKLYPSKFRFRKALEVGSLCVNGSPRKYFNLMRKYIGHDLTKGRGVDVVGRIEDSHYINEFDIVISTECAEHDSGWKSTLKCMYKALKPGGLLVFTCAGPHRAEHGTTRTSPKDSPVTNNYYKNISIEEFEKVLSPDMFTFYQLQYARGKNDLQFFGSKKDFRHPATQEIYQALKNNQLK